MTEERDICRIGGGTSMALSEIEVKRCEKALAQFMERRRPPPELRNELDLSYRISGQSVEVFEVRPEWRDRTKKFESAVAKATFVRTKNRWKVYWMRRDLKWHGYGPHPEVLSIEAFLQIVDDDEFACFFG
jgi:hypothetical protein